MTHIVRVDPDDQAQVELLADLLQRANQEDWAELAQQRGAMEFVQDMTHSETTMEFYLIAVGEHDLTDPIGTIELTYSDIYPGEAFTFIRILRDVQGYGFGRDALDFVKERCLGLDRRNLETLSAARSLRDDRNARFLLKSGWTDNQRLLRQDIVLDDIRLDEWRAAGALPPGYDIELRLDDLTPTDIEELLELSPIWFSDPWSDEDAPRLDRELVIRTVQGNQQTGLRHLDAIARESETGAMVGFTNFRWRDADALVEHYSTFVAGDHRGQRLSTALKAAALRRLREAAPGMTRARSFLPEADAITPGVNRSLGYTDTAYYRYWRMTL